MHYAIITLLVAPSTREGLKNIISSDHDVWHSTVLENIFVIVLCRQPLSGGARAEHASKRIDHRHVLDRKDIGRGKNLGTPRRSDKDPRENWTLGKLCYIVLRFCILLYCIWWHSAANRLLYTFLHGVSHDWIYCSPKLLYCALHTVLQSQFLHLRHLLFVKGKIQGMFANANPPTEDWFVVRKCMVLWPSPIAQKSRKSNWLSPWTNMVLKILRKKSAIARYLLGILQNQRNLRLQLPFMRKKGGRMWGKYRHAKTGPNRERHSPRGHIRKVWWRYCSVCGAGPVSGTLQ